MSTGSERPAGIPGLFGISTFYATARTLPRFEAGLQRHPLGLPLPAKIGERTMQATATGSETLNRYFLEIRARILDVAACLDRIDRRDETGAAHGDPRWDQIHRALTLVGDRRPDRAERVQLLFSLPYDADWAQRLSRQSVEKP